MSKLIPLIRPLGREILERCWEQCQDIDALVLNVLRMSWVSRLRRNAEYLCSPRIYSR